jgi:hypothetical protein
MVVVVMMVVRAKGSTYENAAGIIPIGWIGVGIIGGWCVISDTRQWNTDTNKHPCFRRSG